MFMYYWGWGLILPHAVFTLVQFINFANDTEDADLSILRWDARLITFLKTGHTLDNLYILRKDFSFMQRLNSFAVMGDNSELIFLRPSLRFYLYW